MSVERSSAQDPTELLTGESQPSSTELAYKALERYFLRMTPDEHELDREAKIAHPPLDTPLYSEEDQLSY